MGFCDVWISDLGIRRVSGLLPLHQTGWSKMQFWGISVAYLSRRNPTDDQSSPAAAASGRFSTRHA